MAALHTASSPSHSSSTPSYDSLIQWYTHTARASIQRQAVALHVVHHKQAAKVAAHVLIVHTHAK
jgi:hypothetical protein